MKDGVHPNTLGSQMLVNNMQHVVQSASCDWLFTSQIPFHDPSCLPITAAHTTVPFYSSPHRPLLYSISSTTCQHQLTSSHLQPTVSPPVHLTSSPLWQIVPILMNIPVRITDRSMKQSPTSNMLKKTRNLINLTSTTIVSKSDNYLPLRKALLNARSITNKSFISNYLMVSKCLDILFLTETWRRDMKYGPLIELCLPGCEHWDPLQIFTSNKTLLL